MAKSYNSFNQNDNAADAMESESLLNNISESSNDSESNSRLNVFKFISVFTVLAMVVLGDCFYYLLLLLSILM